MPTYGYECTKCGHRFEVMQRVSDEPIHECESCGGPVKKLIFPVGIVFKGSGFHINDYGKNSSGKSTSSAASSGK
jgi:putative FmdB family regulatory protein